MLVYVGMTRGPREDIKKGMNSAHVGDKGQPDPGSDTTRAERRVLRRQALERAGNTYSGRGGGQGHGCWLVPQSTPERTG